ncbi:hypothetical protein M0802_010069 [Mischocyttarus mexicanus]|nr:hypothetical protein M0802_010069 [Mischocyttarus mexicanus]
MKYQLLLLFAILTSIQSRSIIYDEIYDNDEPKKGEISLIDEIKNMMEQFIQKNVVESTTNLPWLTLPEGFSSQTIWQLPRRYFKRSENSDSNLTKQQDNNETWNNEKLSIEEEAKMIKTCAEQIDEMLRFIQNALGQFRKYLNEWCRNHHSMVKISPELPDTINVSPKN